MHPFARLSLVSASLVLPAAAVVVGPYTADSDTVHLFHLNEAAGSSVSANAVSGGAPLISFNGTTAVGANDTAQPALTSMLGNAGPASFGNAASISNVAYGLGLDANLSGGFQPGTSATTPALPDGVAHSTFTAADGSFTLEALINVPNLSVKREIISTDSVQTNRCFQFYTDTDGTLKFNFIGTASATATAPVPASGAHAFVANQWFHVAYVFNGATSASTFYWTRLAATSTQANALVTTGAETTTASYAGPLVIGNEGRGPSAEGLLGLIDEVRISKVARTAGQFLFAPDDSDNDGLSDTWEMLYFQDLDEVGSGDPDGDGYSNEAEETAGTSPADAASNPGDQDADGLPDAWETSNFGGIAAQNGGGDPDGDFATNLQEFSAGTNPNGPLSWPDADNDQLNDGWEILHFTNLSRDGTADGDSDGSTDRQEHDANSDPLDPQWSATASEMKHRWSFNGNLNDSVGTATSTLVDPDSNAAVGGTGVLSSSDVLLGGGARASSAYIQLGAGGLLAGRKTPVTIELWATQVGVQNWARIFDFGSGTTEYLFMSWTRAATLAQDQVRWLDATSIAADDKIAPYATGTAQHIVMTIEPRAGAAGSTRVTVYAAPAGSPTLGSPKWTFDTTNTLLNLNDTFDYLGRSQFAADNTANARYDECRIWNGILTTTERQAFHAAGPDVATVVDSDDDGLPDAWEIRYFNNLDQTAEGDADGDSYTNAIELDSLSNPNLAASTPADLDADGLKDSWEIKYFGNVSATPAADADGDGETNLTEQTNGSAPNHRASNSADIDADALPDAWELTHFSTLSHNGGSDPDGDGFGNLQELTASTNPANVSSRPSGTAVKLVPLDDGDNSTSDFGYAGSSAINSVAFVRSSIKTVGSQQFITWYGRHQYDAAAQYNNTIWIGRRTLGSSNWEIFRHPSFTANTITDGHDVISYGIDGDGFMHVSWGMHGDAFHYSKSTTPVTGTGPIALGPDTTMTGLENEVTYPQFLKLPSGDVLFIFREVASGNGDTYVNRYSIATKTWSNVHGSTTTQSPFIKGTGWSPNYNAYLNMPQLGGPDGDDLVITWGWRYEPVGGDSPGNFDGYQTNNNMNFARSPDAGLTWKRFNGTSYSLPITRDLEISAANKAEIIVPIPEGSSLINQASTCLDRNDNPVTCTWWAPETVSNNYRRQYMVVFRDDNGTPATAADDTWQTRAVSNRASDPTGTRYAEDHVRDLGRPIVVSDDDDRIIVSYRDNQSTSSLTNGLTNGLTIVHSLPRRDDPHHLVWMQFNLTAENLGNYEPIIDNELWDRERQLHFLYQPAEGQGYVTASNLASRFSVLEWDAASYFNHHPQPGVSFSADKTQITITCPSQPSWSYRLWSSTNLENWSVIETRAGTGQPLEFTQAANLGETKRFWRIEFKEGGF
ncbi:MAG: BNR-4 repeat-containing protein [Verrucomicrobiota bacterium]